VCSDRSVCKLSHSDNSVTASTATIIHYESGTHDKRHKDQTTTTATKEEPSLDRPVLSSFFARLPSLHSHRRPSFAGYFIATTKSRQVNRRSHQVRPQEFHHGNEDYRRLFASLLTINRLHH
jgi:hypothetical protein